MNTYLLTGQYIQRFTVIVHSDGDDEDITEQGYAAFDAGQYKPDKLIDVEIFNIEQVEGNTDPEEI